MQASNLKMAKCPICGGTGRTRTAWDSIRMSGKYGIIAECRSCGAKTMPRYSLESAVAEWNEGNITSDGQMVRMSIFDQEFCDG